MDNLKIAENGILTDEDILKLQEEITFLKERIREIEIKLGY